MRVFVCILSALALCQAYDYKEVLRDSLLFYEAQRSGKLPSDQKVTWRKDSALNDKGQNGEDLTGGYYDAGDYVKFGFPMAYTATVLAWGLVDNQAGYSAAGALNDGLKAVKWATDYFIKAHVSDNVLYGQVGEGGPDHAYWGRPEDMTMSRPAYKIDTSHPGSDLAAETAAALAAASIVFKSSDSSYANTLLTHAKQLYDFAKNYRGKYSDSITDAQSYYASGDYKDELVWGAVWLYRATNDNSYLTTAEQLYNEFGLQNWNGGFTWDSKISGVEVLLAKITNKQARVRRDEERVAAEEKEKERRTQLAEGEARNAALKQKSLLRSGQIIPVCEEPHRHINLFEDLEQGTIVSNATNADYEKEKKEEREKYEKQIGYLTYLGQDTVEATGCVSWYNKLPDRGSSGNDSKKKTLLGDPLNDIRRYLNLEKVQCNSRKGRHENREEKRKYTENEKNAVRRAHKKSKKKTKKHESRKRTRSSSSSSSGSATSADCTDSKPISPKNANKLEQLRAQRLKREEEERKRSEALLARLRGEPELNATKSDDVPAITQHYHSQFNPHLARQNKL